LYASNNPIRFIDIHGTDASDFLQRMYKEHPDIQQRDRAWNAVQQRAQEYEKRTGEKIQLNRTTLDFMTDPKGAQFQHVMLSKETIEIAQGVSMATLMLAGGEILGVGGLIARLPRGVQIAVGVYGAGSSGVATTEAVRGVSISGDHIDLRERSMNLILGVAGLSSIATGFAGPKKVSVKDIGEIGAVGEQELKKLGGTSQVRFKVKGLLRKVDQLVEGIMLGTAHESKVGEMGLDSTTKPQIAKDVALRAYGFISDSVWHFFRSPVTGKIGPDAELLQALESFGIKVKIHYFKNLSYIFPGQIKGGLNSLAVVGAKTLQERMVGQPARKKTP
jgi:hypothetical protein